MTDKEQSQLFSGSAQPPIINIQKTILLLHMDVGAGKAFLKLNEK